MLSLKTCIEIVYVVQELDQSDVDRIFEVFDLQAMILPPPILSKPKKANILLGYAKAPSIKGPFGKSFQMDLLQYVIDLYCRKKSVTGSECDRLFIENHQPLANSLKRDGYIVKSGEVKKLLPTEIEEAKTESELMTLLRKYKLTEALGHLEQAIDAHSRGNWAGANGQFRPFIESLLIGICQYILPGNKCESGASAIKMLSHTAMPPFLRADLNEVSHSKCDTPFVEGLWKRLHPEGAHPGLSDADDSTFRYHTAIVFAHYLLKKLAVWKSNKH